MKYGILVWISTTKQVFLYEYQNTGESVAAFILITEEAQDDVTARETDFKTIGVVARDRDVIEPGPVVVDHIVSVGCSELSPRLG